MLRRRFLSRAGAGLAAGSAILGAPAIAAEPSIRWRLASSFPKNLDTIYGAAELFAHQISLMSEGKFQ
ncbi:MAG TPA: ABC transporter substrate-binding protein, partial [Burkholderiaceae bacterium]|nr:ABC transporter substrate-binding protein [Burkholderiaceae bacterium]